MPKRSKIEATDRELIAEFYPALRKIAVGDPGSIFTWPVPWYRSAYATDSGLHESFGSYAAENGLQVEFSRDCAINFTPECATLILDNLDDWAAWHLANA